MDSSDEFEYMPIIVIGHIPQFSRHERVCLHAHYGHSTNNEIVTGIPITRNPEFGLFAFRMSVEPSVPFFVRLQRWASVRMSSPHQQQQQQQMMTPVKRRADAESVAEAGDANAESITVVERQDRKLIVYSAWCVLFIEWNETTQKYLHSNTTEPRQLFVGSYPTMKFPSSTNFCVRSSANGWRVDPKLSDACQFPDNSGIYWMWIDATSAADRTEFKMVATIEDDNQNCTIVVWEPLPFMNKVLGHPVKDATFIVFSEWGVYDDKYTVIYLDKTIMDESKEGEEGLPRCQDSSPVSKWKEFLSSRRTEEMTDIQEESATQTSLLTFGDECEVLGFVRKDLGLDLERFSEKSGPSEIPEHQMLSSKETGRRVKGLEGGMIGHAGSDVAATSRVKGLRRKVYHLGQDPAAFRKKGFRGKMEDLSVLDDEPSWLQKYCGQMVKLTSQDTTTSDVKKTPGKIVDLTSEDSLQSKTTGVLPTGYIVPSDMKKSKMYHGKTSRSGNFLSKQERVLNPGKLARLCKNVSESLKRNPVRVGRQGDSGVEPTRVNHLKFSEAAQPADACKCVGSKFSQGRSGGDDTVIPGTFSLLCEKKKLWNSTRTAAKSGRNEQLGRIDSSDQRTTTRTNTEAINDDLDIEALPSAPDEVWPVTVHAIGPTVTEIIKETEPLSQVEDRAELNLQPSVPADPLTHARLTDQADRCPYLTETINNQECKTHGDIRLDEPIKEKGFCETAVTENTLVSEIRIDSDTPEVSDLMEPCLTHIVIDCRTLRKAGDDDGYKANQLQRDFEFERFSVFPSADVNDELPELEDVPSPVINPTDAVELPFDSKDAGRRIESSKQLNSTDDFANQVPPICSETAELGTDTKETPENGDACLISWGDFGIPISYKRETSDFLESPTARLSGDDTIRIRWDISENLSNDANLLTLDVPEDVTDYSVNETSFITTTGERSLYNTAPDTDSTTMAAEAKDWVLDVRSTGDACNINPCTTTDDLFDLAFSDTTLDYCSSFESESANSQNLVSPAETEDLFPDLVDDTATATATPDASENQADHSLNHTSLITPDELASFSVAERIVTSVESRDSKLTSHSTLITGSEQVDTETRTGASLAANATSNTKRVEYSSETQNVMTATGIEGRKLTVDCANLISECNDETRSDPVGYNINLITLDDCSSFPADDAQNILASTETKGLELPAYTAKNEGYINKGYTENIVDDSAKETKQSDYDGCASYASADTQDTNLASGDTRTSEVSVMELFPCDERHFKAFRYFLSETRRVDEDRVYNSTNRKCLNDLVPYFETDDETTAYQEPDVPQENANSTSETLDSLDDLPEKRGVSWSYLDYCSRTVDQDVGVERSGSYDETPSQEPSVKGEDDLVTDSSELCGGDLAGIEYRATYPRSSKLDVAAETKSVAQTERPCNTISPDYTMLTEEREDVVNVLAEAIGMREEIGNTREENYSYENARDQKTCTIPVYGKKLEEQLKIFRPNLSNCPDFVTQTYATPCESLPSPPPAVFFTDSEQFNFLGVSKSTHDDPAFTKNKSMLAIDQMEDDPLGTPVENLGNGWRKEFTDTSSGSEATGDPALKVFRVQTEDDYQMDWTASDPSNENWEDSDGSVEDQSVPPECFDEDRRWPGQERWLSRIEEESEQGEDQTFTQDIHDYFSQTTKDSIDVVEDLETLAAFRPQVTSGFEAVQEQYLQDYFSQTTKDSIDVVEEPESRAVFRPQFTYPIPTLYLDETYKRTPTGEFDMEYDDVDRFQIDPSQPELQDYDFADGFLDKENQDSADLSDDDDDERHPTGVKVFRVPKYVLNGIVNYEDDYDDLVTTPDEPDYPDQNHPAKESDADSSENARALIVDKLCTFETEVSGKQTSEKNRSYYEKRRDDIVRYLTAILNGDTAADCLAKHNDSCESLDKTGDLTTTHCDPNAHFQPPLTVAQNDGLSGLRSSQCSDLDGILHTDSSMPSLDNRSGSSYPTASRSIEADRLLLPGPDTVLDPCLDAWFCSETARNGKPNSFMIESEAQTEEESTGLLANTSEAVRPARYGTAGTTVHCAERCSSPIKSSGSYSGPEADPSESSINDGFGSYSLIDSDSGEKCISQGSGFVPPSTFSSNAMNETTCNQLIDPETGLKVGTMSDGDGDGTIDRGSCEEDVAEIALPDRGGPERTSFTCLSGSDRESFDDDWIMDFAVETEGKENRLKKIVSSDAKFQSILQGIPPTSSFHGSMDYVIEDDEEEMENEGNMEEDLKVAEEKKNEEVAAETEKTINKEDLNKEEDLEKEMTNMEELEKEGELQKENINTEVFNKEENISEFPSILQGIPSSFYGSMDYVLEDEEEEMEKERNMEENLKVAEEKKNEKVAAETEKKEPINKTALIKEEEIEKVRINKEELQKEEELKKENINMEVFNKEENISEFPSILQGIPSSFHGSMDYVLEEDEWEEESKEDEEETEKERNTEEEFKVAEEKKNDEISTETEEIAEQKSKEELNEKAEIEKEKKTEEDFKKDVEMEKENKNKGVLNKEEVTQKGSYKEEECKEGTSMKETKNTYESNEEEAIEKEKKKEPGLERFFSMDRPPSPFADDWFTDCSPDSLYDQLAKGSKDYENFIRETASALEKCYDRVLTGKCKLVRQVKQGNREKPGEGERQMNREGEKEMKSDNVFLPGGIPVDFEQELRADDLSLDSAYFTPIFSPAALDGFPLQPCPRDSPDFADAERLWSANVAASSSPKDLTEEFYTPRTPGLDGILPDDCWKDDGVPGNQEEYNAVHYLPDIPDASFHSMNEDFWDPSSPRQACEMDSGGGGLQLSGPDDPPKAGESITDVVADCLAKKAIDFAQQKILETTNSPPIDTEVVNRIDKEEERSPSPPRSPSEVLPGFKQPNADDGSG